MAYDRLTGILTGGAASRADSISGLDPEYAAILDRMLAAAPPEIAEGLKITSGFRSPQVQERLWNDALKKYGSPEAARKWVAPPGKSQHNHGRAIDWSYASNDAKEWVRTNAEKYGAVFPLANEPWHMELIGARGNGSAPVNSGSTQVAGSPGLSLTSTPTAPAQPTASIQPSTPPTMGGTVDTGTAAASNPIASIIGGLAGKRSDPSLTEITPSAIGAEAGSQNAAQAALLMSALMDDRRRRYGLSLNGMG